VRAAVGAVAVWATLACGCAEPPTEADRWADEWPTGTSAAHGLDEDKLAALVDSIGAGHYGDIGSLLVVRHGALVLERYFGGSYPDDLVPVASVTKSVTSALIGLAVDAGRITGLGTPIHTFLPQLEDIFAADSAKRAITLEHVLTMTPGLAWDESWPPAPEPGEDPDWLRLVLSQPLVDIPGTRFRYSTGSTLLLSGVLERVYGMSAEQVAVRDLFQPLGITDYRWPTDSSGLTPTGSGLALRARDLAKIGQLYLGGGTFRGRRVLSESWVQRSTSTHVTLGSGDRFGYLWWLLPTTTTQGEPAPADVFYAAGSGEQYVFVLPSVEMVVVVTAYNYGPGFIDPLDFIVSEILPAVLDRH